MFVNSISPDPVNVGQAVTVAFTVDEAVVGDPVVTLGGNPMTLGGVSDLTFYFGYTVTGLESEGEQELLIDVDYVTLGHDHLSQPGATTFDFSPPDVVLDSVTPEAAKSGALVTAAVTVTDAYSGVTTVAAALGGASMDPAGQVGNQYSFSYSVTGLEPEGPQDLLVTAEDEAGNPATLNTPLAATFDFSGPSVATGPATPAAARVGTVVTVTATVTDTHTSVASVTATLGGLPMVPSVPVGNQYGFSYTVTGAETEGWQELQVTAVDAAGNQATYSVPSAVVLDFHAPGVVVGTPSPAAARDGVTVTVTVTVTDSLSGVVPGSVAATLGGKAMTPAGQLGDSYTFTYLVAAGDGEGLKDLVVTAYDQAGNPINQTLAGAVLFDFTLPGLSLGAVTPSMARQGTVVAVTATVTDAGSGVATVVARLGGLLMAPGTPSGSAYPFSYTVPAGSVDGWKNLEVTATDAAGNVRIETSSNVVLFDLTAPIVAIDSISPTEAADGSVVTVTVTVTESGSGLGAGAVTASLGGKPMTAAGHTGDSYTFTYIVPAADGEGPKDLVVTAQDQAGNPGSGTQVGAVLYDFTAPVLSLDELEPVEAKAGAMITALIRIVENGSGVDEGTVMASLGGHAMTFGVPTGDQYPFTYQVQAGDGEGWKDLLVTVSDDAGNPATLSIPGAVRFDFTAPSGEIRVAWDEVMAPVTIPGPEPLNRFQPSLTLNICVRVNGGPLDLAASWLRVERSDTGYGSGLVQVYDRHLDETEVVPLGSDYFAGQGPAGSVVKMGFTTPGYYVVTAQLQDLAGNPSAPVTARFRTKYPYFSLRQGMPGASWNSPDILMLHTDDLQSHYNPASYPTDQGSEVSQFESGNDNFIGLRIRNTGNEAGDCKYRIFCVPGAVFTNLDTWKLITKGSPAPAELGITPAGSGGVDPDGYRITAGTNYNALHAEWPDWTPPPGSPDQALHTCVCAVVHGPQDPLVLRDADDLPVVVTDTQMDTEGALSPPTGFKGQVMAALASYGGSGGGYWEAVFGNDKVANVNFSILVTAAKAKSSAGAGVPEEAKGLDELPFPKPPFPPPDLPPEALPRPVPPGFRYTPWLHDKIVGWTEKTEKEHPRPILADPGYVLQRLMLRTRGLPGGRRNEILVDRRRFPDGARVFCRLPLSILSKEPRARAQRLAPGQSLWKGTRLVDPKTFARLFPEKIPAKLPFVPLEIVAARALLEGLALTDRAVFIDVAYGARTADLRPKTGHVLVLEQHIDGRPVGNFDFLLRAYHPFDVPIVGDRRSKVAYRRSNALVANIPARALELFDSVAGARAAGYRLDPREFGKRPGIRLPDGLWERLLGAATRRVPLVGRLTTWLREEGATDLPEETLAYLGKLPMLLADDAEREPDPEILEILAKRPGRAR